jgi:hypothetical protein
MAYYTPPGGSLTASVGRALQDQSLSELLSGLGISPSINVRMPRAIPAAFGAARHMRESLEAERFAARRGRNPMMTGIGILTPTPNVTARRFVHAVPPPVTFAVPSRMRAAQISRDVLMSGLGRGAHPATHAALLRAVGGSKIFTGRAPAPGFAVPRPRSTPQDVLTVPGQTQSVHRQSAIFMSPGGGYSQIPGYMPAIGPPMRRLSFMGLGQDGSDGSAPPDVGPGTVPLGPLSPTLDPWQTQQPVSPTFSLPTYSGPVATTGTYNYPALKPPAFPPNVNPATVTYLPVGSTTPPPAAPRPAAQSGTLLGVPTSVLAVAGVGIVLLGVLSGGKRKSGLRISSNPKRRARRRRYAR